MRRLLNDRDLCAIKQQERRWQDRQGGALQERAYDKPGTRVVLHGQFRRLADALQLQTGMRVLDLGCGVGHFLAWLAPQVRAHYHGADLSLNSLGQAHKTNPALQLVVADAESLPYKDGSFDRIACNGTAHHFLEPRTAFREAYRVLAPGGIFAMLEPTTTALTHAVRRVFLRTDRYESPADLVQKEQFTAPRVTALLHEAGFTDISTSVHDFLAYPLSGNYLGSPLSRSSTLMMCLSQFEGRLHRLSFLKPLLDLLAWRLLVISMKPKEHTKASPSLPRL